MAREHHYLRVVWNSGVEAFVRVNDGLELATRGVSGWTIREATYGYLADAHRVAECIEVLPEAKTPWGGLDAY